ncbi:MAG: ATP-binding protein [Dehalococcoidales bacterium]
MKKIIILLLGLTLFYIAGVCSVASADDAVVVKVGIYENQPEIFTDNTGNVSGFWPDIISYIASKEGWEIEYVPGTLSQCLEMLEKNEIDIVPDVAYTEDRAKIFDFSRETVYESWSRVYARTGANIQSILDLQGKTIAVLKGSVNFEGPDGIKTLTKAFDINCTFIAVDSYIKVFELVDKKEADAGVVNRDFAYSHESNFNVVETPIVFQPTLLYFAFPQESSLKTYLIERIDNDVRELKENGDSIYYQSLDKWLGVKPIEKIMNPEWIEWVLIGIGIVALLFGGGAFILRTQVRKRTKELAEDIVKRQQTEKELRESEERLRLILETIPVGLAVSDMDGKILQVNRAATKFSGFSEKELVGKKYLDFIGKKDQERAGEYHDKAAESVANQDNEYILKRKDGSEFPAKLTGSPIKDQAGNIIGTLAMIEDITERRQAEEEHREVIEYRELDRLKTNLLSTVSHELRTPLASIKGYASLLLMYNRRLASEQKRESLEAIDRSTDRLTELIEHLLDMSRLDAGLFRLNLEAVKPSDIFSVAVSEAKLRSPKYKFKVGINRRLPKLMGDARRLRQVIDNLLDNAIKYSPKGTQITVRAEVKAEELLVSVADQGQGIPADEIDKIFDRMYRIEQRLGKDPGGLGLGLSLCKALVGAHGGRIWVESQVGQGSTFYFTIPLKNRGKGRQHAEKEPDKDSANNRR